MDLTTAWVRQLHLLVRDLDPDERLFGASAQRLVVSLNAAVPSFCGFDLSAQWSGQLVRLTAFDPSPGAVATTSLGWRMAGLRPTPSDRLVLYATRPGALVDLAADLQFLGLAAGAAVDGSGVDLDQDLPPRTTTSGLTGLADLALLSRAEGALLDGGTDPADVELELRRQATAAGLDRYTFARQLLGPARPVGEGPVD